MLHYTVWSAWEEWLEKTQWPGQEMAKGREKISGGWLLWRTQQGEQTLCPGCDIVWLLLSETAKWNSLPCCPPSHPTSFS